MTQTLGAFLLFSSIASVIVLHDFKDGVVMMGCVVVAFVAGVVSTLKTEE